MANTDPGNVLVDSSIDDAETIEAYESPVVETTENLPPQCSF